MERAPERWVPREKDERIKKALEGEADHVEVEKKQVGPACSGGGSK